MNLQEIAGSKGSFAALLHLQKRETCALCAGFFMLNRELSVSLQSRLTLAIVLSPGNYPQDNFLPPEGATFLEPCAYTKTYFQHSAYTTRCSLQLSTNH